MADEILAAELDIEIRKYRKNMDEATRKAKTLDVELEDVSSSARKADKSLNAIKGGVNVDIKADSSSIDQAESKVKSLDGASPTITPEVDDSGFKSFLDSVKSGAILTIGVVGAAAAGVGAAVGEDIRSDRAAVGAFALGTGQTREEAAAIGDTINDVWNTGLAETKTQIAGVAAELYRAGVDIEDIGAAATDAFTIAAATGEDVSAVIRAQTTLVRTGLASSYAEASDVIAGGFAEGLNSSGDFLDTINEYSQDFADLRLTASDFFTILDTGLEGGAYNTDKIADAFRELKIRVDTALSSGTGSEYEGLRTLGLLDEAAAFRAGEITGQQWVDAVLSVTSAANLDAVVTGTFGSPIEDLGVNVFQAIDEALGNPALQATWAGTTETMRDTLSDNLDVAFKRAYNVVVNDLASGFQIAGQPLTDLFDSLPEKLNEFSDLVTSGAGIPEALEIALEAPGLSAELRDLQGMLGGFLIDFQLGLAAVLGVFDSAAGQSLRTSAAAGAAGQLAFDLQFAANPEEITLAVNDALRRGVDPSAIAPAFAEATSAIGETMGRDAAESFAASVAEIEEGEFRVVFISNSGQRLELPLDPMEGETGEQALMRQYPYGSEARVTALRGLRGSLAFNGEQVIQGFGDIEGIAEAAITAASVFEEAFIASDPISQAAIQANIAPALQGAWSEAMRNIQTEPDPALAQASADALVTLFNQSLLNTGVEPVTLDELFGIINTGALKSNIDEVTGLFAEGSGVVGEQVNLTNDTIVESYRLMGQDAGAVWDDLAVASEVSASRQVAAAGLINGALIETQNLAAGAGVDLAAFAAYVFGGTVDAPNVDGSHANGLPYVPFNGYTAELHKGEAVLTAAEALQYYSSGGGGMTNINTVNINVTQSLNAGGMAQASAAGSRFANSLRGY